jgi:hypothetical protein
VTALKRKPAGLLGDAPGVVGDDIIPDILRSAL